MPDNAKLQIWLLWPLLELIAEAMDTRELHTFAQQRLVVELDYRSVWLQVSESDKQVSSLTDVIITSSRLAEKGYLQSRLMLGENVKMQCSSLLMESLSFHLYIIFTYSTQRLCDSAPRYSFIDNTATGKIRYTLMFYGSGHDKNDPGSKMI